jgi:hypothetical protein
MYREYIPELVMSFRRSCCKITTTDGKWWNALGLEFLSIYAINSRGVETDGEF